MLLTHLHETFLTKDFDKQRLKYNETRYLSFSVFLTQLVAAS